MAGEVIADDNIPGIQSRDEYLLDVLKESGRVHWSVKKDRCVDPVVPQRCDEGVGVPMAMRGVVDAALRGQTAAVKARHLRVDSALVDEHELPRVPALLESPPECPLFLNVRAVLLPGV